MVLKGTIKQWPVKEIIHRESLMIWMFLVEECFGDYSTAIVHGRWYTGKYTVQVLATDFNMFRVSFCLSFIHVSADFWP